MTLLEEAIEHAECLKKHNETMAGTCTNDPQMKAWYLGKVDAADSILAFFKNAKKAETAGDCL